ncbi:unnamed protein product [Plutella xylostella]|uniref:(diamondback moth) hypothetical protein n=1 Tax=Plutella xylostella TaxID=51655 RepID=A0A8S4D1W6_PLUXY|nr:unnamed protein product [Plutella xylostella]
MRKSKSHVISTLYQNKLNHKQSQASSLDSARPIQEGNTNAIKANVVSKSTPLEQNPLKALWSPLDVENKSCIKKFKQKKEKPKIEATSETIKEVTSETEISRFVEISKYFSSPLKKTASYLCENILVTYPNHHVVSYVRGETSAQHIKFTNLTLEPVYIKLYKVIPDLEQIKFINLTISRCKRIPPGLSLNISFMYDDAKGRNTKNVEETKMVFVASKKSLTPCYQICEIKIEILPSLTTKNRQYVVKKVL